MPPVIDANLTMESASVLGTRSHPYDRIVSGNRLKTANIIEDFTQFEPETNPMPANGRVGNPLPTLPSSRFGIGYPMPSIPSNHIVIGCHRPLNVTHDPGQKSWGGGA
jgi:hypothetical protein